MRVRFPSFIREPKPFKPYDNSYELEEPDLRPIEEQIEEAEREREERHSKGEPHKYPPYFMEDVFYPDGPPDN